MHAAAPGEHQSSDRAAARLAAAALFVAPFVFFWPETVGRRLFAPSDAMLYFFPVRVLTAQFVRAGYLPLWNPFIFSGVPFLGEIQTAVLYPANLLFFVLSPLWAMNLQMIATYSVAAVGTFAYARAAGCSVFGAGIGGLTFAWCGFMMGHLPHTGVVQGASWLPVLLYCLERLRQGLRWRYVAGGAAAIALAVFAGHPQMAFNLLFVGALYGVYFGLIGGVTSTRGWRYLVAVAGTLAAGVLLSAVQLVPTAELAALSVRAHLDFSEFTMFALPLAQLPMLLTPFLFGGAGGVPYWGVGGYPHEVLGYVGLIPVMLVLAALPILLRSRWAWFWMGLAAFAFLMALGPATPLPSLMYHVPIYNLFRVAGRHFLHFDLALAVLAAWSATHLGEVGRRWAVTAALLVAAAVLVVALTAVGWGHRVWDAFAVVTTGDRFATAAFANAFAPTGVGIGLPVLLALLSAAAVIAVARWPSTWSRAFLLLAVCTDLGAFGGLVPNPRPTPDRADAVPDFVRRLTQMETSPGQYRLALAPAGEHTPARYDLALSAVPIINGYEPLMPVRYQRLTAMTYYGVIGDFVLAARPHVLDLLNTRYIAVTYPGRRANAVGTAAALAGQGLEIEVPGGERAEFALPVECAATGAAIASAVRGAAVEDGAPVARLRAFGQDGDAVEDVLIMGRDTARWEGPAERDGHGRPAIYQREDVGGAVGTTYLRQLDFDRRLPVRRLTVEALAPSGALRLSRLSLVDATTGASCPLTALHTLQRWPERWERVYGDGAVDLLRNRGSLPRAWLVPRGVAVTAEQALAAAQTGELPDRQPFDARTTALVEDVPAFDTGPLDAAASVRVIEYTPNRIELQSRAETPAFLVLSEMYYPGWGAEIDGQSAPIVRTDYVLRGLALPAGAHRIRFVYRPRSVAVGAAISLCVAGVLAAGGLIGARRKTGKRRA